MNMFKPVNANSVEEYIEILEPERKTIIKKMDLLIKKSAPNLKRYFAYNMIGYGSFKYKNYKKQYIDWPIIALASQKNYISLYVCALENGEYIAEKNKNKLGKVSVGKSCIRFNKFEDLNLNEISKIITKAANNPGIVA